MLAGAIQGIDVHDADSVTILGKADDGGEKALIARAQQNDCRAYEVLYRTHVGRVQAWRKLGGFRGDSAFGSWLYRIATNTVLSYLRQQKPFRNSLDIDDMDQVAPGAPLDVRLGLDAAIGRLPDGARTVFVLYSLEGYSHDEIAGLLGIAEGSSKAQLHRARRLLRGYL
jgi:RNA polymerase sigma factor (sigma-70 family)